MIGAVVPPHSRRCRSVNCASGRRLDGDRSALLTVTGRASSIRAADCPHAVCCKAGYCAEDLGKTCGRSWRMGWDSNPRDALTPAGFQDRCLQPLGHPSAERYQRLTNFAWGCKPGILRRTGVGKVCGVSVSQNEPRWRQGQRGGKLQVAEGESQSATHIAIYNYRTIHSPIKYHLWVKKKALETKALRRRWRRTTGRGGNCEPFEAPPALRRPPKDLPGWRRRCRGRPRWPAGPARR